MAIGARKNLISHKSHNFEDKSFMNNKTKDNNTQEYYTIDLIHIAKSLWNKIWAIALAGLFAAGLAFGYASFVIKPTYSASIMLYVNNSSISLGNTSFNISASDLAASQSLVNTYSEILNNRTTLERVIEKTNVPYTYKQLSGKIKAAPANETEIMRVTVTTNDPYEAADIANCIAEVLPVRISEIIDGASMEVVDSAVPNLSKVAPSITTYTMVGMLLGILLSAGVVVVFALLDDTIHDEEYILNNYSCPILAKIPDLTSSSGKHYSYYYQDKDKGKENPSEGG